MAASRRTPVPTEPLQVPEPGPPDLSTMSAIASGTHAAVRRWASALKRAGITPAVAESCEPDPDRPDYAELWVEEADVDEARAALGFDR